MEGWSAQEGVTEGRAQGGLEFDWTWRVGTIPTSKDKEAWPAGVNKVGHTTLLHTEG